MNYREIMKLIREINSLYRIMNDNYPYTAHIQLFCPLGKDTLHKKKDFTSPNEVRPLLYFHLIDLTMKKAIEPVIPTIKMGSTHTLNPSLTPLATSEQAQVI